MTTLSFNPATNTAFNNVKFADQPAFGLDVAKAAPAASSANSSAAPLVGSGQKKAAEEPKFAQPESHTSWWNPAPQLPTVRTGSGQPMTVPNGLTTASQVATNTWVNNNFDPMLDAVGIAKNFDVRTFGDAQTIARNLNPQVGDVANSKAHIGSLHHVMNQGSHPSGLTTTYQIGQNLHGLANTVHFGQRANQVTGNLSFTGATQIMQEAGMGHFATPQALLNFANPNGFAGGISTDISPTNLFQNNVRMSLDGTFDKNEFAGAVVAAHFRPLGTPLHPQFVQSQNSWGQQRSPFRVS